MSDVACLKRTLNAILLWKNTEPYCLTVSSVHVLQDAAAACLAESAAFQAAGCSLLCLHNCRTPGASGAWNTSILHIMQQRMLQHIDSSSSDSDSGSSSAGTAGSASKHVVDPCTEVFVAFLGEHCSLLGT
jgi:hypothetical protein